MTHDSFKITEIDLAHILAKLAQQAAGNRTAKQPIRKNGRKPK